MYTPVLIKDTAEVSIPNDLFCLHKIRNRYIIQYNLDF